MKKRVVLFLLMLFVADVLSAQSQDRNYIKTSVYTGPETRIENIEYYDGFGRPIQTVRKGESPDGRDLVTFRHYENNGKVWFESLPVPYSGSGNYTYASTLDRLAQADSVYATYSTGTTFYYDQTADSRLVREEGAGNRGGIDYYYTDDSGPLKCNLFLIWNGALRYDGWCGVKEHLVTKIVDEDRRITYQYRNRLGQMILSRQVSGNKAYDTYYVYDDSGNLCYVLPPLASERVVDYDDSDSLMCRLAYIYKYDDRNRCISKKLPGLEPVYYVYDDADRQIFTQDGNQRARGEWAFSIPDVFGRPAVKGICCNSLDVFSDPLDGTVVSAAPDFDGSQTLAGYTVSNVALSSAVVLEAEYYDDYGFLVLEEFESSGMDCNTMSFPAAYQTVWDDGSSSEAKGLPTGKLTALLDGDSPDSLRYRCSATYYDMRKRPVQTFEVTHDGYVNRYGTAYDYQDRPLSQWSIIGGNLVVSERSYDSHGRVISENTSLNNVGGASMSYSYDKFGRLAETSFVAGDSTVVIRHSYTPNGWILGKSGDAFGLEMRYNNPRMSGSKACFSGNISELEWTRAGSPDTLVYSFAYDSLGRVSDSRLFENGSQTGRFSERDMAYDGNGNLLYMTRSGVTSTDTLRISYDGNQISGNVYDANGNVTYDASSGLSLEWNHLNLIRKVSVGDSVLVNYSYLADGTKVRASDASGDGLEYMSSLTFVRSEGSRRLESALFDGGRIVYVVGNPVPFIPHYHLTDHLGSVRAVIDGSTGQIIETNDYYAFGGRWEDPSSLYDQSNRYRYNGKEEQSVFGTPYSDYGARQYSSPTGRWLSVDPMAEKYHSISPYAFCNNNPVNLVDKDGRFPDIVWDMVSIGMGVRSLVQNVQSGNVRGAVGDGVGIVVDAVAAAVPFVPGGMGAIRAGAKAVNVIDNAADAAKSSKTATLTTNAVKTTGNTNEVFKVIHGNSRMSSKSQHAYDIIDTETGNAVKTGVSGGKVRRDGKSYRAEQQVRKWNAEENTAKYKSVITHTEPEGAGARDRILEYEIHRADYLRQLKQLDENKHIRP